MTEVKYTPEQVIRAITNWQHGHKYGLYSKAGKLLGIEAQRVRTMTTAGRKGVITSAFLRLLMAAKEDGSLLRLTETMKQIDIETEMDK